jgi:vitamin K-dependent gamma-carboxylase-like protein
VGAHNLRCLSVATAIAWLAIAIAYQTAGSNVVELAYRGESVGLLNRIIATHRRAKPESRNLRYYQEKKKTAFIELSLVFLVFESSLFLKLQRGNIKQRLNTIAREFFHSREHPVNLAVFRIVFFSFFAWSYQSHTTVWFSQLPRELVTPPLGFGWFLHLAGSFDAATAEFLGTALRVSCISAAIGFFTRSSALVAAVLGYVLLGIPQSYGKGEGGNHIMIWVALLFAASRSADMLSLDAVVKAIRRAEFDIRERLRPSRNHALPLRFTWILMGIAYFFAGMWKAIDGRWEWIFSENLRYHVFTRALERNTIPHFAMILPSWFFYIAALFTVVFELSFIALIVFPRGRAIACATALLFHNGVRLLMGDVFLPLQVCCFSLINWDRLFTWWGKQRHSYHINVQYNRDCRSCRRAVSCARVFDVLQTFAYVDVKVKGIQAKKDEVEHKRKIHLHSKHVSNAGTTTADYAAFCSLGRPLPLIWFAYPALVAWHLCRRMWRSSLSGISLKTREIVSAASFQEVRVLHRKGVERSVLVLIGVVLVAANALFGLLHAHGWPFTCFPTFHHIATPECHLFAIERTDVEGNVVSLDRVHGLKNVSLYRLQAICANIYHHSEKPELAIAFCDVLKKNVPGWQDSVAIRFYIERNTVLPAKRNKNPLDKRLFHECK